MDIADVQVFLTVAKDRSFSRAAWRLHRSQPVVSLTIRRLEKEIGEQLFDRSSKGGVLTEAGKVFRRSAEQLVSLSEHAQASVRELKDLRRGRVVIGANEGSVHSLLPLIARFTDAHPQIFVDVRRVHARDVGAEVAHSAIDFGVTTFKPASTQLRSIPLAIDELAAIVRPDHKFAMRSKISLTEWSKEPIIVHSDPSPARERVFRRVEEHHRALNARVALPTIEGIKQAVELGLGISLLPLRCVVAEITSGRLVAVPLPELRSHRLVRLVYRKRGTMSYAASAFLQIATEMRAKPVREGKRSSPSARVSDHAVPAASVSR